MMITIHITSRRNEATMTNAPRKNDETFPCMNIPPLKEAPGTMFVHVLPHFRGDTIIVQVPDPAKQKYTCIFIDVAGFDEHFFSRYFERFNISSIDYLFITHPHKDHFKGVQPLLEHFVGEKGWDKPQLWETTRPAGLKSPSKAFKSLQTYFTKKNYVTNTFPGSNRKIKAINLTFLGPSREFLDERVYNKKKYKANNASLIFIIDFSGTRLLFTGDAEVDEWARCTSGKWTSPLDILTEMDAKMRKFMFMKLAHHGSINGVPDLQEDRNGNGEIILKGAFAIATRHPGYNKKKIRNKRIPLPPVDDARKKLKKQYKIDKSDIHSITEDLRTFGYDPKDEYHNMPDSYLYGITPIDDGSGNESCEIVAFNIFGKTKFGKLKPWLQRLYPGVITGKGVNGMPFTYHCNYALVNTRELLREPASTDTNIGVITWKTTRETMQDPA
ncbi:MAG: ComEC/Rec2 family competence protein [Promethearchaeota archaeon]